MKLHASVDVKSDNIIFANRQVDKQNFTESVNVLNQRNADFKGFAFLELDKVNLHSESFSNVSVRAAGDKDSDVADAISRMQCSLNSGWDITQQLPVVDGDTGEIVAGRHRTKAAILNGETHIPVSVFTYTDKSLRNYLINAQKENWEKPYYRPVTKNDIAKSAFDGWKEGEIYYNPHDTSDEAADDVIDFFIQCGFGRQYNLNSPNGKGQLTAALNLFKKSVNQFKMNACDASERIITKQKSEWVSWLKDEAGIVLDSQETILVPIDYSDNVPLAFHNHIPKRTMDKKKPLQIIFYMVGDKPEKYAFFVKETMKAWHTTYKNCFDVSRQSHEFIEVLDMPFVFLGAVPQMVKKHKAGRRQTLISISEII